MRHTVNPAEPLLYLVRVWHTRQGFRASARRVDSEATQWLDSPQALVAWLTEQGADTGCAPPGPACPGPAPD